MVFGMARRRLAAALHPAALHLAANFHASPTVVAPATLHRLSLVSRPLPGLLLPRDPLHGRLLLLQAAPLHGCLPKGLSRVPLLRYYGSGGTPKLPSQALVFPANPPPPKALPEGYFENLDKLTEGVQFLEDDYKFMFYLVSVLYTFIFAILVKVPDMTGDSEEKTAELSMNVASSHEEVRLIKTDIKDLKMKASARNAKKLAAQSGAVNMTSSPSE